MTTKVSKREFLSKDPNVLTSVSWSINVDETWPDMSFQLADGSSSVYLNVYGKTRKDLNESLGEIVKLRDNLDEFIALIKDNQTEILKAYV